MPSPRASSNPVNQADAPKDLMIPPAKVARIVERFRHYLYRLHQRSAPAVAAMFELVSGAWVAQAVQVAAELRIADALSEEPLPLEIGRAHV